MVLEKHSYLSVCTHISNWTEIPAKKRKDNQPSILSRGLISNAPTHGLFCFLFIDHIFSFQYFHLLQKPNLFIQQHPLNIDKFSNYVFCLYYCLLILCTNSRVQLLPFKRCRSASYLWRSSLPQQHLSFDCHLCIFIHFLIFLHTLLRNLYY